MANWYGTARSNYFRVKDNDAFTAWTTRRGLGVFTKETQPGVFAIHPEDGEGSWPRYDMETTRTSTCSRSWRSTSKTMRSPC